MKHTPLYFNGETLVNAVGEMIRIEGIEDNKYRFVYYPELNVIDYEKCRIIDLLFCLATQTTLKEEREFFNRIKTIIDA